MSICGFRGCEGTWGSKGSQYQNGGYSEAPKPISPKPNGQSEVPRAAPKLVASATQPVTTQKARGDGKKSPQEHPTEALQRTTSEITSGSSSSALGGFSDTFFQPIDDPDKKKESFWVSPSLAAWLTGKDRQATAREDASKVKDIIEQAVEKTGRFKPDGVAVEDDLSQKGIGVDVDFGTSDNAMKKLIITGEPEKRKQAMGILKELTSKCQKDSASTLIDSWQMFSDEIPGDKTATSSRGHPRFGIPSPGQGEAVGAVGKKEKEPSEKPTVTITNLRRNLVSKYERELKQEDDQHGKHTQELAEGVPMKVLQLSFPLATLPSTDTPRSRFEAELKKCLNEFKKDSFAGHRVTVSYKGPHIMANVMVPVASLEDVRSSLTKNPPVVCGFKAMVPEKLIWCKICQKEHEPDKLCYKNFQTDGRFDESLTSFLGECQQLSQSSLQEV